MKQTVAGAFFENSRGCSPCMEWLALALQDGLDPNLLLSSDYYEQEAMLIVAMRAGNADAMITLLHAGASPHGYQNLWFTAPEVPRFLFPYAALLQDDRMSLDEKRRLAQAYRDAGAVLTRFTPGIPYDKDPALYSEGATSQTMSVEEVLSASSSRLGMALGESPTLCDEPASAIAIAATQRTGIDWVQFIREMPKRIAWSPGAGSDYLFQQYDVKNLLAVVQDKAYFLGVTRARSPEYILIEVSRDGVQWHIYCHMQPEAGMGHCKKEDDYQPEGCWRRINMTFSRSDMTMLVEGYYKYKVSIDCH
jgi:hypothetical protein